MSRRAKGGGKKREKEEEREKEGMNKQDLDLVY